MAINYLNSCQDNRKIYISYDDIKLKLKNKYSTNLLKKLLSNIGKLVGM